MTAEITAEQRNSATHSGQRIGIGKTNSGTYSGIENTNRTINTGITGSLRNFLRNRDTHTKRQIINFNDTRSGLVKQRINFVLVKVTFC